MKKLFAFFKRRAAMKHRWHYRNPYDRTCEICKRHEVEHCYAGDWAHGWWEVFNDGNDAHIKLAAKG